jgi:hypothetical protein
MHASIWKLDGDPDDLARRCDALFAEFPPEQLQLCLRAPDGLVIVDTCSATTPSTGRWQAAGSWPAR